MEDTSIREDTKYLQCNRCTCNASDTVRRIALWGEGYTQKASCVGSRPEGGTSHDGLDLDWSRKYARFTCVRESTILSDSRRSLSSFMCSCSLPPMSPTCATNPLTAGGRITSERVSGPPKPSTKVFSPTHRTSSMAVSSDVSCIAPPPLTVLRRGGGAASRRTFQMRRTEQQPAAIEVGPELAWEHTRHTQVLGRAAEVRRPHANLASFQQ